MPTIKLDDETYARLDQWRTTDRGEVTFNSAVRALLEHWDKTAGDEDG